MKAFKKEFKDFATNVPRNGHVVTRKVAKEWFSDVVRITPKDTQFTSSVWSYKVNTRPGGSVINNPRFGSYSPASTPSFSDFKMGDKLYVFNNAAWIVKLENGYSKKAPRNFFKNATARANYKLQREYDKLNWKNG